jgi:hypothetical protein
VTSDARLVLAPDIPTFTEMGLPALSYSNWAGLFVPMRRRPNVPTASTRGYGGGARVGDVRIGQRRTIEARLLLSTVILSDSKRKLFCVAQIGWSKCGERNAKKPDAFRDWELGSEQIQANPLQCGSFFDYSGQ